MAAHNRELRHILTLSVGSIIAHAIPLLASLVLIHLYSPEEFGYLGVFMSYADILCVIVTGQYALAIVRTTNQADTNNAIKLSVITALAVAAAVTLCITVALAANLPFAHDIPMPYLLPLFIIMVGLLNIYNAHNNHSEMYRVLAQSSVIRNAGQALSRIAMGIAGTPAGLIWGALVGVGAALAYCERHCSLRKIAATRHQLSHIWEIAKRYRKFPLFQLPGSLLTSLSTFLPIIILSAYFGKDDIGYLSVTITLLYMPVLTISDAMGRVFYRRSSVADTPDTAQLASRILKISFAIGAAICAVLLPAGCELFAFVLGDEWATSGTYATIMAPMLLLSLCLTPLTVIFDAKDKQNVEFGFTLALSLLRVGGTYYAAAVANDIVLAVLFYAITGIAVWIAEGTYIARFIKIRLSRRLTALFAAIAAVIFIYWVFQLTQIF